MLKSIIVDGAVHKLLWIAAHLEGRKIGRMAEEFISNGLSVCLKDRDIPPDIQQAADEKYE